MVPVSTVWYVGGTGMGMVWYVYQDKPAWPAAPLCSQLSHTAHSYKVGKHHIIVLHTAHPTILLSPCSYGGMVPYGTSIANSTNPT